MEPRPFVRVAVSGLGLRIPVSSKASRGGVHAAASPCTCEISLPNFPKETVPISLVAPTTARVPEANNAAASFYLDESALEKLLIPSWMRRKKTPALKVRVYLGKQKLGTFKLPVSLDWAEGKPNVLYSGWTCIGDAKATESGAGASAAAGAELHVEVKVEADPRYMFQFEKVTALSPQIIQVSSKNKQSIFSCKFSRDKLSRCRVGAGDISSSSGALEGREKRKERKGWLVMVHDLSGSPVAAASMVTPFVPATGSDYVARSNPGAWLILRPESPGAGSWRPWGRLEAWREKGGKGVGSRFQLLSNETMTGVGNTGVLTSETLFSAKKGGEFTIDVRKFKQELSLPSPVESRSPSPRSSGELSMFQGLAGLQGVGEFVMSCGVRGDRDSTKPLVQVAMRHVTCVEDVAVFIALAAAVDLSVDACQPFRRRLRKELGEVLSSSS